MKGLWHYADTTMKRCRQDCRAKQLDVTTTLGGWLLKLEQESRGRRIRLCFRCVYEMALELEAPRHAFLKITLLSGGRA
jgi:hypothetical protein